jgi:DNA-binding transcriptional MocR family regulator
VSSALVTVAGQHGVLLAAGPRFGLDGAFERCIRLPYTLPEPGLAAAMQRLASAWASLPATGTPGLGWSLPSAEVA